MNVRTGKNGKIRVSKTIAIDEITHNYIEERAKIEDRSYTVIVNKLICIGMEQELKNAKEK